MDLWFRAGIAMAHAFFGLGMVASSAWVQLGSSAWIILVVLGSLVHALGMLTASYAFKMLREG